MSYRYSSRPFKERREPSASDEDEGSDNETSSEDEDDVVYSKAAHYKYGTASSIKYELCTPEKQKQRSSLPRQSRRSRDDDYGVDALTKKAQNISLEETPEEYEQCRLPVRHGWYGPSPVKISPKKCKTDGLNEYLKDKTGEDPNQSGIYYFSHKGRQHNPGCKATKCHYVGKTKNLKERISGHFSGNLEFDKCLQNNHKSNSADYWNLEFWPVSEDELSDEEHDMIEEKSSLTPNGHNKKR